MLFQERYKKLNKEQKQAVDTIFGSVIVLAGPGSGKTEILSLRIAHILQETDTDPSSILCLTFTENGAKNMRKRLLGLIGNDAHRVSIFTFHGFGSFLMQRYAELFHGGHEFQPADDVTRIHILQEILKQMPIEHPLASYSEEHGFSYERDILSCISDLRRAGIDVSLFRQLIHAMRTFQTTHEQAFLDVFSATISKKTIAGVETLISALRNDSEKPINLFVSPAQHITIILERILHEVGETNKTTPLSKFKADFFDKTEQGQSTIFSEKTLAKWDGLADIYEQFIAKLAKEGWYDYDDMIMNALFQLEHNAELRARIHEQYQFVMVDEYQDTSTAQLRFILQLLPEENPNIFIVGDDDQSIYAFQGADVRNLKTFFTLFQNIQPIILATNYRSKKELVSFSQAVIQQADERIDHLVPELKKTITSFYDTDGIVDACVADTWDQEQQEIASRISSLIADGVSPGEIAIIAREHAHLIDIANLFQTKNIPIHYDGHANILEHAPIRILIDIWQCIDHIQHLRLKQAEEAFFSFARHTAFRIPVSALYTLHQHAIKEKMTIFDAHIYKNTTAELKDMIVSLLHVAKDTVESSFERVHERLVQTDRTEHNWPWFSHAFLKKETDSHTLETIFALRLLIQTIRSHYKQSFISIKHALECISAYKDTNQKIALTIPGHKTDHAVHLLTAHASKGLEYEYVFIVHADDATWFSARNYKKITLPFIIPDHYQYNDNESIRLFYVSATRAKHQLTVSRHIYNEKGKEILPIRIHARHESIIHRPLTPFIVGPCLNILATDEVNILNHILEQFSLTATHVNTFIDLTRGGPEKFKWNNLFQFPTPKTFSSVYGTLVHAVLATIYQHRASIEQSYIYFDQKLATSSLDAREKEQAHHLFHSVFSNFYEHIIIPDLNSSHTFLFEYPVRSHIDAIPIRGSLDKVVLMPDNIVIVDYKTGSPHSRIDRGTEYQKLKVHKYMRQIQFYFLLIAHDPQIPKKTYQGRIEFFAENKKEESLYMHYTPTLEELNFMKRLVQAIYTCIHNHSFPQCDMYPKTLEGVRAFEEDLVNGKYA